MLFACGSCQLMSLGPIVPGLLLSLLIMAATLSFGGNATTIWQKILNLVGMLGLLFFTFALFPIALLPLWLLFAVVMLVRLVRQETRKVAGAGIACVVLCLAALKIQDMNRGLYDELDRNVLSEHQVMFYAHRPYPMNLSVAELVSALDGGPQVRQDNAKALLAARAKRAEQREAEEVLKLLQGRGDAPELERKYQERLERQSQP